jgi:toxin ParE1/3/4
MDLPAIVYALDAERDLTELFDYIAADAGLDRAEMVLRRIDETLQNLVRFPRAGRVRSDLSGSPRSFSVWPWVVIYEPQPNGKGIFVWRVLDGSRDIAATVRIPRR